MSHEQGSKPSSELFKPVSEESYSTALDYLRDLRHRYPGSSDWDLLLFALAQHIEKDKK